MGRGRERVEESFDSQVRPPFCLVRWDVSSHEPRKANWKRGKVREASMEVVELNPVWNVLYDERM